MINKPINYIYMVIYHWELKLFKNTISATKRNETIQFKNYIDITQQKLKTEILKTENLSCIRKKIDWEITILEMLEWIQKIIFIVL